MTSYVQCRIGLLTIRPAGVQDQQFERRDE
jgi:hypothetical protein